MPKVTQIVNGEYIGGDKYKITDVGGGKSKVEFSPDNIIKAGTPVGAEILNEVQNNIIYEVLGTRVIEGQEEIYNCTLTGLDAFDFTNIKILMKVDSDNTKDSFLRIGDIKYKIKNKGNNLIAKDLNFNEFVFISLDRSGGLANIINNAYSGVDSNSNVRTASSQAVKKAYDKALTLENSKLDKGGYTKTAKDLDDAIKINSTDISTLKTGKADKSYVDQTFTDKGNYPRTSKNIIEEVMDGEYGDTLNNTDTKTVGKIYYDTATKRNFLCKTQNNLNYANLNYYDDITNKELNSKLKNLYNFYPFTNFVNGTGIFKTYKFSSSNSIESPTYPIGVYLVASSHTGVTAHSVAGIVAFGAYNLEDVWRKVTSLNPEFSTTYYNLEYNQFLCKLRNTTVNPKEYFLIRIG